MNEAEKVFLNEVRNASPEDCKTIIKALFKIPGQGIDDALTPLGLLIGALTNELMTNGVLKMEYDN